MALLVGPALGIALTLSFLGAFKSPAHRLAYICLGHAPTPVNDVRLAGYSTFLRAEWLAMFRTEPRAFQAFVAEAKLERIQPMEFQQMRVCTGLKSTQIFQTLPATSDWQCFRRVFKEAEEHKRGSVYAAFDPATVTTVILRIYSD